MNLMQVLWLMSLVVANLPSAEAIQSAVNERFDDLLYKDKNGNRKPFVCVICDKILMHRPQEYQITREALTKVKPILSWSNFKDVRRTTELESQYAASPLKQQYGFVYRWSTDEA